MIKFIVRVYLVENGKPNLNKVDHEICFENKSDVNKYIRIWNKDNIDSKAFYHGCVNNESTSSL